MTYEELKAAMPPAAQRWVDDRMAQLTTGPDALTPDEAQAQFMEFVELIKQQQQAN